jgi:PTS system cellobiose-specific IIC component
MTFFISVGIGASLGRQFQLDPVMSGLLAFMAFLPPMLRLNGSISCSR